MPLPPPSPVDAIVHDAAPLYRSLMNVHWAVTLLTYTEPPQCRCYIFAHFHRALYEMILERLDSLHICPKMATKSILHSEIYMAYNALRTAIDIGNHEDDDQVDLRSPFVTRLFESLVNEATSLGIHQNYANEDPLHRLIFSLDHTASGRCSQFKRSIAEWSRLRGSVYEFPLPTKVQIINQVMDKAWSIGQYFDRGLDRNPYRIASIAVRLTIDEKIQAVASVGMLLDYQLPDPSDEEVMVAPITKIVTEHPLYDANIFLKLVPMFLVN
jgi:hypothetical protein